MTDARVIGGDVVAYVLENAAQPLNGRKTGQLGK
jgi:hypothetical protein